MKRHLTKGQNSYGETFTDSNGKDFPLIRSTAFAVVKKIQEEENCSNKQAWGIAYTVYGEEQIEMKKRHSKK